MRRTPALVAAAAAVLGLAVAPVASAAGGHTSSRSDRIGVTASALQRQLATGVLAPASKLASPAGQDTLPTDPNAYGRIAGDNRYETAVEVSAFLTYCLNQDPATCSGLGDTDNPVLDVFIAAGSNWPDALGAGPVAAGLGPLLLVPSTGTVPAAVLSELDRIGPNRVVVFGGAGAVSTSVVNQVKAHTKLKQVLPIAGADRYDTAAQATTTNNAWWSAEDADGDGNPDGHGLDMVVIASGETYADALAGGGAAAGARGSLLLTKGASLPAVTKSALQTIKPPKIVIAGGTGVVSDTVLNAVKAASPTSTVVRAAGTDRFGTAIAISKDSFPSGTSEAFLVYAYNFPDALAVAPLAGYLQGSTLLAKTACVTSATRAEVNRLSPDYVTGVGGPGVVSDNAITLGVC